MESFYDRGSINLNNKEKLIQDNYSKVNQISARCMRVIVAILVLAFVYCYFGTDMDESVLIVFFASAIFIALIPTLIINILKFDHAPVTKHIVIICVCLIATLMLTLLSTYAYPIMLFPILLASLYYNQTLVLFASLLMSCGIVGSNYFAFRFSDVFIGFPCESFEEVMMSYVVPQIVVVFGLSVAAYFIVQRNSMMINSAINMAVTMQDNQTGLIFSFAEISESKSKFTGEHIKRVAAYMRVLAKASGFDDEYVEMVSTASMMKYTDRFRMSETRARTSLQRVWTYCRGHRFLSRRSLGPERDSLIEEAGCRRRLLRQIRSNLRWCLLIWDRSNLNPDIII